MNNEHWRWVRNERRRIAGKWCETPGCVRPNIDAHHVTYVRKGREWIDDIRMLCRECHDEIHDLGGPVALQLAFADLIRAHAPSLVRNEVAWWRKFSELGSRVEERYQAGDFVAYHRAEEEFYVHCRRAA